MGDRNGDHRSGDVRPQRYRLAAARRVNRRSQICRNIAGAALWINGRPVRPQEVTSIVLTILVFTDTLELWHAYVIVTAGSMVRMLDLVLVQALTADAVPAHSLHGAIGLSRSTLDGARVVGSIAGGTIFCNARSRLGLFGNNGALPVGDVRFA